MPTEDVVEIHRDRKVNAERKFFPGYVLVKMDMTDEAYHLVKNTPKVTGFLGAASKPMPVSEREVARIIGAIEEGVERPKPHDQLRDRRDACASPTARSPASTAWSSRSTRNGPPARHRLHLRPRDAGRARIRPGRKGRLGLVWSRASGTKVSRIHEPHERFETTPLRLRLCSCGS